MDFPDHNHFLQLQKALWQWPSSRAAVMVGAGLSRNSRPSPGASTGFPTWRQLSRAMFEEIYPTPPNQTAKQTKEREEQFNRSNALRLASEYKAAFGPQQLESFLRAKIPNTSHQPGDIHRLLLQLPWKDVFTTNYDTLLERTEVPERAYQPVTTINDLTTAVSPRIIKLHGSFPSQTPFIITEEDYRTYPQCFAPFVNTVRQSLVENAFVLIGFSGDDPNFLQWTGWIRDELGGHHAPIYLVGPLSLRNVDRSLLAQRGVTPIDLSPVLAGKNSPGEIHSSALKWFLHSLLAAKPQRPERWPRSKTTTQATVDFDLPILISREAEPEEAKSLGGSQDTFDEDTAIKVIERWRFERARYPGWLVPTDEMRSLLWQETRSRIADLVRVAKDWPPAERILLYREILWRIETCMLPLDTSLMEPFETAIDDLFPVLTNETYSETSDKATRFTDVSDTEVPESWLEVAFALLRDAREAFDSDRWNALKEKIDQVVHRYPQFGDRNYYEQAVWFLWNIERSKVKNLLATWSPSLLSPRGMMWKAGLLAEIEEPREARSLLQTALQEIRKSLYKTQGQNIDLLSLEGWCTYLLMAVESAIFWEDLVQGSRNPEDVAKLPELRDKFLERWQELKAWDCDPWTHMEYFDSILSGEPPVPRKEKKVVRGFDPGHRSVSYSLFGGSNTRWLPAFSFLRLYEQVGIPLRFSGDTLRHACEWLLPFADFWSPSLLIRAGKVKEFKELDPTNRTKIASMDPDDAKTIHEWAIEALKREFSSLGGPIAFQSAQTSLLEVLIEAVSRLTLKLESEELHEAFCLALEIHKQPEIISHVRLNHACEPWFERLFEAADDRQLLEWLPDLIRFPFLHENIQTVNSHIFRWPDPMNEFPTDRVRAANESYPELLTAIHEATEWLLERARSESGEGRQRAMRRLIVDAELMTEDLQKSLSKLLWEETDASGLPDLPYLRSCSYLNLPIPESVDAVLRIRKYLLALTPVKSVSIDGDRIRIEPPNEIEDQMILEVAAASKPVIQLPYDVKGYIDWNTAEANEMWKKVNEWWENEKSAFEYAQGRPEFFGGADRYARLSAERLGMFLARVNLPRMNTASEVEWNEILALLTETRQFEVFLTSALPYVLLHRSDDRDMVLQMIRDDLSSDNEKAVKARRRGGPSLDSSGRRVPRGESTIFCH